MPSFPSVEEEAECLCFPQKRKRQSAYFSLKGGRGRVPLFPSKEEEAECLYAQRLHERHRCGDRSHNRGLERETFRAAKSQPVTAPCVSQRPILEWAQVPPGEGLPEWQSSRADKAHRFCADPHASCIKCWCMRGLPEIIKIVPEIMHIS